VGKVILPEFVTIDGVSYTSLWCESNGRVPTRVALQVPGSRTSFPVSSCATPRSALSSQTLSQRTRCIGSCLRRLRTPDQRPNDDRIFDPYRAGAIPGADGHAFRHQGIDGPRHRGLPVEVDPGNGPGTLEGRILAAESVSEVPLSRRCLLLSVHRSGPRSLRPANAPPHDPAQGQVR
jgi:hypothetical protein